MTVSPRGMAELEAQMITEELIRWFATINGIIAAIAVAGNFGRLVTGIGFIIFTLSSVAWIAAGYLEDMSSLILQNVVLTVINLIGIYRYLIADGTRSFAKKQKQPRFETRYSNRPQSEPPASDRP